MNKNINKILLKESRWFFLALILFIFIIFLKLPVIISGSLDVLAGQSKSFFVWLGWNGASVLALIITALFISQQSYFTRKIFQFQTIPSVAFALMSNKTYHEKIGVYRQRIKQDTHFMIYNLSKFPISFWLEINSEDGEQIVNSGPWRINPVAFFKPHNEGLVKILKKKKISEIYVTISYSSLHDDRLKAFERPERWRLNKNGRWIDRHSMEDINDRYWDNFLIKFVQQPDQKGTS